MISRNFQDKNKDTEIQEALYLGLFLTPFLYNPFSGDIEQIKVFFLSGYTLLLLLFTIAKSPSSTGKNPQKILLLSFIAWIILISILNFHKDIILGAPGRFAGASIWITCAILAFITPFYINNKNFLQRLLKIIVITGILASVIALILAPINPETLFEGRISGLLGNPNVLGKLILFSLIVAISGFVKNLFQNKWFFLIGSITMLIGLISTGNRASWIALFIVSIIIIFKEKKNISRNMLLFSITIPFILYTIFTRLTDTISIYTRIDIYQSAISKIMEKAITGYGFDFGPEILSPNTTTPPFIDRAHQLFLDIALNIGIPGLILFISIMLITFYQLFTSKKHEYQILGYAFLGLTISLQFSFFTSVSLLLFFLCLGIGLSAKTHSTSSIKTL